MLEIGNKIIVQEYDKNLFPFYEIFSEHCLEKFNCPAVENLHKYIPEPLKPKKILKVGEDQKTYAHSIMYQIDPGYQTKLEDDKKIKNRGFINTYERFMFFLEKEVIGESLVYQKLPTLRIHFPNNLSVGEYHRDRDYNHPLEEINIWIPVTKAKGTATIHIESCYDAGDFKPIELQYGQYCIFDSALKHGNEVNVEDYTRVSFDFRVIPLSKYKDSKLSSINQKIEFKVGKYYSLTAGI